MSTNPQTKQLVLLFADNQRKYVRVPGDTVTSYYDDGGILRLHYNGSVIALFSNVVSFRDSAIVTYDEYSENE